jgi:hypothetical protein
MTSQADFDRITDGLKASHIRASQEGFRHGRMSGLVDRVEIDALRTKAQELRDLLEECAVALDLPPCPLVDHQGLQRRIRLAVEGVGDEA